MVKLKQSDHFQHSAEWYLPSYIYFTVPPILQIQLPKSITVRAGQPLRIVTKAAGIPAPIYQWFFYPRKDAAPRKIEGQNKATLSIPEPRWVSQYLHFIHVCSWAHGILTCVCLHLIIASFIITNRCRPSSPLLLTVMCYIHVFYLQMAEWWVYCMQYM